MRRGSGKRLSKFAEPDIEVVGQTPGQIVSFIAQINDEINVNLLCIPYNPSYWTSAAREPAEAERWCENRSCGLNTW